ncbi:phosphatase PAP2 family protein [Micromonospora zingiberis]|uniref:Phosphatase PAP2 family protein n=1 Tax=Micromonospora zingiberis TaxID=2053011 RepID=A0A4R0GUM1_9ACTN|nr:phosphatase PAP2 family protein [Micromonospora zingiberis]TCB99268.1 phosphatase PAP2 family protein [Micromonospora zingiberis]
MGALRLGRTSTVSLLAFLPFALLAGLVLGGWPPLRRLDVTVTEHLHGYAVAHPLWVRVMSVWTDAFAPMPLRAAALVLVVWLARRGARRLAVWVATTMLVGGLLGPLLKLLVGRARPALPDPVAEAPGLAFPSGHALNAMLAAGVLVVVFLPRAPTPDRAGQPVVRAGAVVHTVIWLGALLIALVTGFSRIALGVHWTSDVLAGWLLGLTVVTAAATALGVWPRPAAPRRPPAR